MKGRPQDWTVTVRTHWRQVTAYIVSSSHPSCIRMAADEVAHIERNMVHVELTQIARLKPARHWFMAVLVCPGDDLAGLAQWAKGREATRVHFYFHKETDTQALAPWRDAGLPLSRVAEERYTKFGPLHKQLGLDLSDQVYGDFAT